MEDTSDNVNLQLRVGNKIYKATVSSNAMTEILMNKENSEIVAIICQGDADSMVVGQFKETVEILSVSPANSSENNNNPDSVMEVQVCINLKNIFSFMVTL